MSEKFPVNHPLGKMCGAFPCTRFVNGDALLCDWCQPTDKRPPALSKRERLRRSGFWPSWLDRYRWDGNDGT